MAAVSVKRSIPSVTCVCRESWELYSAVQDDEYNYRDSLQAYLIEELVIGNKAFWNG